MFVVFVWATWVVGDGWANVVVMSLQGTIVCWWKLQINSIYGDAMFALIGLSTARWRNLGRIRWWQEEKESFVTQCLMECADPNMIINLEWCKTYHQSVLFAIMFPLDSNNMLYLSPYRFWVIEKTFCLF